MEDTGPLQQKALSDKTDLVELLFKLANENKDKWGYMLGTCADASRGRSNAVNYIAVENQLPEAATVGDL